MDDAAGPAVREENGRASDAFPDALIVTTDDGRILSWNAGAAALFGFAEEDAVGRSLFGLTVPAEAEDEARAWLRAAADAGFAVCESMRQRRDGRVLYVDGSARAVPDGHGDGVLLILIERDITLARYHRSAQLLQSGAGDILDAIPSAAVLVDRVGRLALVNLGAQRLFGYTRHELLGQPLDLLVPEAGRGLHKDGVDFPIHLSLKPVLLGTEQLKLAVVHELRLTEPPTVSGDGHSGSRRNPDRSAGFGAHFDALIDAVPDALVIVSGAGLMVALNAQAEQLFGYTRPELLGQPIDVLVPVRLREAHQHHRAEYARAPRMRPMGRGLELAARHKDGSEFPVEISLGPLSWAGERVVIAAVRDMTERVQLEEARRALAERDGLERRVRERTAELQSAQEALRATNRELEAFTYSVSHDLRAPIRRIDGFCEALAEQLGPDLSEPARHCMERIEESAQQMGRLVDDLLHLARVGQHELRPRPVALDGLLREVLLELTAEVADRDVLWDLQPLPTLECDAGLLKVAFTNLLSNAIKYTRSRRPAVIEVGHSRRDGRPSLYVRDNGVGFDMKYADRLFGVFQRLHAAAEFEGTGVGLATVQRIVHKHGGEIWAEAEPDRGATFYFTLGTTTS